MSIRLIRILIGLSLAVTLYVELAAAGRSVRVSHQRQQAQPEGVQTGGAPPSTPADREAWLRYLEAQRLLGEGQANRDTKLIDKAIIAFRETIRLDPKAAEPHIDLGNIYLFGLGRYDQAEVEAGEAIRLAPEEPGGHLLRGRLAFVAMQDRAQGGDREVYLKQFRRALDAYEKLAELDPRNGEVWAMLQNLYEVSGRTDLRLNALEKFIAAPPIGEENIFYREAVTSPLTEDRAWYEISRLRLLGGKQVAALAAARRAYEADPAAENYEENLFLILRMAPKRDEELQGFRQLLGESASPRIRGRYAEALVRAGRAEEAIVLLRDSGSLTGKTPEGPPEGPEVANWARVLAVAQRHLDRRPAAVSTLRAAIRVVNGDAQLDLRLELAETYEEMGLDREAILQYEALFDQFLIKGPQVTVTNPRFNETVERMVRLLRRMGNEARIRMVLTRTRRVVDEQNPLLDLLASESLRESGQAADALALVRAASRRHPNDRSLVITESSILAEMGQFAESLQILEGLMSGAPEDAASDFDLELQMSAVHRQQGDLKMAEKLARRALELAGSQAFLLEWKVGAQFQLASLLQAQGDHPSAEKMLREILAEDPVNTQALNNLGYFLVERGVRLDEARRLIERAVAIEPVNGSFLDSLGWALFRLGEADKARITLEKALLHSRRSATINEHLGEVLQSLGRSAEARRCFERALEYADEAAQKERLRKRLRK
jgi:tetratricopeptide (TPR) repeat protein